jgi:RNA polymerase sigma-70 factor (sigma-E family)
MSNMGSTEGPEPIGVASASLADLYEQQYASMVRLAHLLTGSNAAAEDLVQDSFARLHGAWDRVRSPVAYLRTSVVNACQSWHRSRTRERARMRVVGVIDDRVLPEARELLDAVEQLPYGQRAALVLRYYEGLSEAEIATAMGCRPGTVKSHQHRGLEQLRKVIER